MLDIKFVRENPDAVKENIKKKFQDAKLPLVDEVLELDEKNRAAITEASELRASRNTLSKQIGNVLEGKSQFCLDNPCHNRHIRHDKTSCGVQLSWNTAPCLKEP